MAFWPQQQPQAPVQAGPWPGFQPQQPIMYNQYGQPIAQPQQWPPFGNDNNPTPWKNHTKYTNLHPILAVDSTLLSVPLTQQPNKVISSAAYMNNAGLPVTRTAATHVRLISPLFPWSIDIHPPNPHMAITVGMVWDALYTLFKDDPIKDSEWGAIAHDRKLRASIEKAAKKRIEGGKGENKALKRIDWVGESLYFKGLERDESFEKARLMPGEKEAPETWIVKLGSS